MQYPHYRQHGWPIGSGMVESANKVVVQARIKGAGMRFSLLPTSTPCWLCAPPSATIAGTKPGRQGKPICVPNELCSNTSTPSHAFWPWHLLLPGLLFGSNPLRLRLPSFQCFLLRLPLCFPEPHALPLIIPGNEPSFPVQRGLQKSDGHPPKRVSVSFLHKCGPRRSHCSAVSCSCQPR